MSHEIIPRTCSFCKLNFGGKTKTIQHALFERTLDEQRPSSYRHIRNEEPIMLIQGLIWGGWVMLMTRISPVLPK